MKMKNKFTKETRRESFLSEKSKFKTQEQIILALMAENIDYSKEDIITALTIYNNSVSKEERFNMLSSSICRAISNLKKEGFIVESGKKMGEWGKKVATYQVATQFSFF